MSKPRATITSESIASAIEVKKVHLNVSQEVIVTTEDKVKLCLQKHLQYLEKKRGWSTPLGIFLTVIAALITTNFKNIGLTSDTWQAIFIIIGALSLVWLSLSIYQATKVETIEDIIAELKA
jgi:Flp pilus assembly protein TadB